MVNTSGAHQNRPFCALSKTVARGAFTHLLFVVRSIIVSDYSVLAKELSLLVQVMDQAAAAAA